MGLVRASSRSGLATGRIGRATLDVEEIFMPLSAPKLLPSRTTAILVVIAGLMAADKPSSPDGYAPPETFTGEQLGHWAYQPVKRVEPPAVKETGWVRNPIDRFILAESEKLGIAACARGRSGGLDPPRDV